MENLPDVNLAEVLSLVVDLPSEDRKRAIAVVELALARGNGEFDEELMGMALALSLAGWTPEQESLPPGGGILDWNWNSPPGKALDPVRTSEAFAILRNAK